jgi:hypothetical protein
MAEQGGALIPAAEGRDILRWNCFWLGMVAIVIGAALLGGCGKADYPPPKNPAPIKELTDATAALKKDTNELVKKVELLAKVNALSSKNHQFTLDCMRVEPEVWKANRCTQRKKQIQKEFAVLEAEAKALYPEDKPLPGEPTSYNFLQDRPRIYVDGYAPVFIEEQWQWAVKPNQKGAL